MANNIYLSKTTLTGGGATALDSIDGAGLTDGDIAHVYAAGGKYEYKLNATSGATESSPEVISPDANAGTKRWILQRASLVNQIISVSASVGSNALTVGLNPCTLEFRSTTLTTGVPVARTVAAALSLVVPSTATLGTTAGVNNRLAILAIDNAGTVELAIANLTGGVNLDETTLITTTTISTGADSAAGIYSATGRTNVAFRVVGFIDITEAVIGTWATAPTTVQGCGGQALAALSSLGYGQTWQSATRTSGTTYYNTTGKSIYGNIYVQGAGTSAASIIVNGVGIGQIYTEADVIGGVLSYIVPPGGSYVITNTNFSTYSVTELR